MEGNITMMGTTTFVDNANKAMSVLKQYEELPIPIRMKTNEYLRTGFHRITDFNNAATADDDDDDDGNNQRRLKLVSILERYDDHDDDDDEFHTRSTLEEKTEMNSLLKIFIERIRADIHHFIIGLTYYTTEYRGLHLEYDRYTEEEVEIAIRLFPEILSAKIEAHTYDGNIEYYPILKFLYFEYNIRPYSYIHTWRCGLWLVRFIPLYARLGIELGEFTKEQRGGLLVEDREGCNTLHFLVKNCPSMRKMHPNHPFNHQDADKTLLQVLVQLRLMGLLKKEDINDYNLVSMLCDETVFGEKRFRFLVEWDPTSLITPDANGYVPLQYIARYSSSIHGFEIVFDYCIRYYPTKEGIRLLFTKDDDGDTPFQMACDEYGYEDVMKVIEDTLRRYASDNTPINIEETFVLAAIDENIHLDGLNYLLRRQPDVLKKLLLSSSSTTRSVVLTKTTRYNLRKRKIK